MSETPCSTDKLVSAGTSSDSPTIQALETLSIVAVAAGVGGAFLAWPIPLVAGVIAAGSSSLALLARRKRVRENEVEARYARYRFFKEREKTIDGLGLPEDVVTAIKEIVTDKHLTRFEVAERLNISIGQRRTTQYLPIALQQADRSLDVADVAEAR